jgi:hypothetical protein
LLRLWSLLQLLDRFNNVELTALVAMIQSLRLSYEQTRTSVGGGRSLSDTNRKTVLDLANRAHALFSSIGFRQSAELSQAMVRDIERSESLDYSSTVTHLRSLEQCALREIASFHFVQIRRDRENFFPFYQDSKDHKKYFWFGPEVDKAFPSAKIDISEAGYCLSVEANTAAVYHLMCAVEHGLRALARDRRVSFLKGPLALQQWGEILRELEKKVSNIDNWPKSMAREAASEFFNKAMKDCASFNGAYRRHIAHARRHYDRHEALSVMTHVRSFMQHLSTKISEKKKTPVVWKRV